MRAILPMLLPLMRVSLFFACHALFLIYDDAMIHFATPLAMPPRRCHAAIADAADLCCSIMLFVFMMSDYDTIWMPCHA